MVFQFAVSPTSFPRYEPATGSTSDPTELLRQILEVGREQLAHLQALTAYHNSIARWQRFLNRWQDDFPNLGDACQQSLPMLERTFNQLIVDMSDHLSQNGSESLDNDFELQEFLDRYGLKVGQLGTILNAIGPLAEAGGAK